MQEWQAVKFENLLPDVWHPREAMVTSSTISYIRGYNHDLIPIIWNGIVGGYYADREQQNGPELQLHSLDSLGPSERIASAHLSPLVKLSGAGRTHESSTPGHAMIKR